MVTDLKLKGNDLMVYAIIYGFSQAEGQKFTGSLQYLAEWCGATKQGIIKNLKNLIDRGLIQKFEPEKNGIKSCEYSCMVLNSVEYPIKLSLTNNIDNNKKVISKDITTTKFFGSAQKQPKQSLYDKCVSLIYQFTDDSILREFLIDYLYSCLQNSKDTGIPFYTNNFKGKLNQLKKLSTDSYTQREIVKQSLDFGWANFYAIKSNNATPERSASAQSVNYTQEELDELSLKDEERRRNGERTVF